MEVNQSGDPLEREADRVADQVMRMTEVASVSSAHTSIERNGSEREGRGERKLQRRSSNLSVPSTTHSSSFSLEASPVINEMMAAPIVHDVLRSSGQPIDLVTRAFMEPRFGQDFGNVRVHSDTRAAESADALNAAAYTGSGNIVFGRGYYEPATIAGRRLLAHELTHVVQQQGGVPTAEGLGKTGESHERKATQLARKALDGHSAENDETGRPPPSNDENVKVIGRKSTADIDAEAIHVLLYQKEIDWRDLQEQQLGTQVEHKGKFQEPEVHYKNAPSDFVGIHAILEKYRNRPRARQRLENAYQEIYNETLTSVLNGRLTNTDYEIASDMMMTRRRRRAKTQNPAGLSRQTWTEKETKRAKRLVDIFESEADSSTFFPNIEKAQFAMQLRIRLDTPSGIYQGGTWLCGPTACSHLILNYDPYHYTQIMIDLYRYGQSKVFGNISSNKAMSEIKTDASGKVEGRELGSERKRTGKETSSGMNAVDFILIGAIRKTTNEGVEALIKKTTRYDPRRGISIESGTMPWEVKSILVKLYGFTVEEHGFYLGGENIESIKQAVAAGKPVILFINETVEPFWFDNPTHPEKQKGSSGRLGIHYVVIDFNQSFSVTDDRVDYFYWDYGGKHSHIDVTRKRFHRGVKGYWIVRPKHME